MDIMNDVMGTELYDEDDVRACTLYSVKDSQVVECMRLYTLEVLVEVDKNSNYFMDIMTPPDEMEIGAVVVVNERNWEKLKQSI